ncbi:MAG: PH domain-containing protein [Rhodospirillales bacterium]|nr:PH domain-containing protein [Rhodospirillales bacterium]MCB9995481.1 PH domain-containing protein [Rhodospirillales bacterium]
MLYIQESLSPDEELVHVGHFHWMYTLSAILGIVWGIIGCIAVIIGGIYFMMNFGPGMHAQTTIGLIRELHPGIRLSAFFVFLLGLLSFAQKMIIKATTEIAITNSRLIYKRGLVARYVGEMSIDRIEGVNVLQGIFGRIFNYGRVMVRGMGVGEVVLPPLADPVAFRRAIEKARVS